MGLRPPNQLRVRLLIRRLRCLWEFPGRFGPKEWRERAETGRTGSRIGLTDAWVDRVLAQVHLAYEVKRAGEERKKAQHQIRRLGQVYVDTVEEKRIVANRPKPTFRPLLEIATMREGSGIVLVTQRHDEDGQPAEITNAPPPGGQGADEVPCSWWSRGRRCIFLKHERAVLLGKSSQPV